MIVKQKCTFCSEELEYEKVLTPSKYRPDDYWLKGLKPHSCKDMETTKKYASILGSMGGNSTLKRYGKEKMTEWGKKGGRPKSKALKK